ncbi:putative LRR receptor-like serine/threonine-protein kinase [Dichanthelium oligosanthes]|uniref:non-specific serine/threonine protein kinase n=1 Tax=Dichanthelium oligosanthes TaxID=888268 RepID=A0A1E5VW06_9POAL|nr:putative LRR receptor-like serine/threonine-protein kinase [Dichanthelium oligosanthes]
MKPRLSCCGFLLVLLLLNSWRAAAQAQPPPPPPQTDPVEAAAVNAILSKLGLSAAPSWNISGNPCSGAATDDTQLDDNPAFNPAIKCDCSDRNNTLCHVTRLDLRKNYFTGPLPAFIGELTALEAMTVGINALSGPIPKELGNLTNLLSLALGSNNFNGTLPDELGKLTKLRQIYIDSNDFSGPLPSTLSQLKNLSVLWASDNNFTGQIPDYLGSLTNLTELRLQGNSFQGPIPKSLSNLVKLSKLRIGEIVNGSSPLAFISNMTSLGELVLRNSKISDTLASVDFSKFGNLSLLDLSFNNITGQIHQSILNLPSLSYLCSPFLYLFSEIFHTTISQETFLLGLLREICNSASFAVDCGGGRTISGSDNSMYQADNASLGAASYYVAGAPTWGVSSVGLFTNAPNGSYIIYSSRQFDNTLDSSLFQTARMSPSSLRYYGIGLENGNYTVTLQFAEVDFPDIESWRSRGRRVFDIYVQGERKEQNFDIRKTAGGRSFTVVKKQYVVPVTKNFLEIHLFWAGKGTCCIPYKGYYGPAISALSATPNFVPTVRSSADSKSSRKTGVIVGVVVGVSVFALIAFAGIFLWCQKRRKLLLELEELYTVVGRPNVFSYSELRSATENFCSSNLLGEGGYGSVYKGKLSDGRVVAVKQLSQSSNQGNKQFAAEIVTISQVQHRNLVRLYGCCLESNTPLLVYEYLENGSLDHALFGKGGLHLDWPTRFEICLGIARGIAYLHEESTIRIVHRDIKASNVLLDADLSPKISDFGLAKLYDDKKTHVSTKVAVAEEQDAVDCNNATKSLILNPFQVWELYENGRPLDFVDPKLAEYNGDEVLRVIRAALYCTQGAPHKRPPMSKVVSVLTGDADMIEGVTKPSYITEWQVKAVGSGSFTSSLVGSSSTQPSSGVHGGGVEASPELGDATPVLPSALFTSIIEEGR